MKTKEIPPVHPGEVLEEEFFEAAGTFTVSAGEGHTRTAAPDKRDCFEEARHYGGHGPAAGALLRDDGGLLAEPTDGLRKGNRAAREDGVDAGENRSAGEVK